MFGNNLKHEIFDVRKKLRTYSSIRKAKRHFSDLPNLENPFFIIGIPGSLCEVNLCLKFIPDDQPIIFVANGLDKWESTWVKNNLQVGGLMKIGKMVAHAEILDLLFDMFRKPFGIIDYDCFVFEPSLFAKLTKIQEYTLLNAYFVHLNRKLNLDIPETFFMFFNTIVINKIRDWYNVGSALIHYNHLSNEVKQRLLVIGIDDTHYLEEHKDYFDTARLLIALGLAKGFNCNYMSRKHTLTKNYNEVFHVGAGHKTNRLNNIWNIRGTYFWRRSLETCKDRELQAHYYRKYGNLKSSEIPTLVPELCDQIGEAFFECVEKIVNYE